MIIDGREVAENLYAELAAHRVLIDRPVRLGVLVGHSDPVIESFVRIKARAAARLHVDIVRRDLAPSGSTKDAATLVGQLSGICDGIIVQLPLPRELDTEAILAAIPPRHDVDGINPTVVETDRIVHAPVAEAVREILARTSIDVADKIAVVVGEGRLVGAPSAALLRRLGADVSVVTKESGALDRLKQADIVVLGAGEPGFIRPEHLKQGVVLIDAGTSESSGRVVGDADPTCAGVASVFTPVPGGVGPVAVAMIFKNLFNLVEKSA